MPGKRLNNEQTARNYRDKTFQIDSIIKQQLDITTSLQPSSTEISIGELRDTDTFRDEIHNSNQREK